MKKNTNFFFVILLIINTILTSGCGPLIVASAAGTVAVIADRRTTGTIIEDNAIELKALKKLNSNSSIANNSHITVTSYNERILVTGQVKNSQLKNQVVETLRSIPKIRTVYNELRIADNSSFKNSTYDTWLTTKIKTKFASDGKFNPLNVKVVTEDNIVYLLGLVTKNEATAATNVARQVSGVKKVVKLFEYIDASSTMAMN